MIPAQVRPTLDMYKYSSLRHDSYWSTSDLLDSSVPVHDEKDDDKTMVMTAQDEKDDE